MGEVLKDAPFCYLSSSRLDIDAFRMFSGF
jgi:hypothetical protein